MSRILYIHCGGDTVGGIETYLAQMLKYHHNEAYLGIVRLGMYSEYLKIQQTPNVISLRGGRLSEVDKVGIAIRNACRFVRKHNISIIIAKGYNSWLYGSVVAYLTKRKSIFYVANDINPNYWKYPITCVGSYLRPTHYVANSNFTAASVLQILKKPASVVYPAANTNQFDNVDNEEARKQLLCEFNIPRHHCVYVIVGRLQKWKGQHIAIRSFRQMRHKANSTLLVVGDYTHKNDRNFFKSLQQLVGNDNIIFTGFRSDVPHIVAGSDIVVHTSITPEPFGITIIEGMLAKKPVIASAAGGPLEIIDNEQNGLLVERNNPPQLAQKMDLLYEKRDWGARLGQNAYTKARKLFSIEASVQSLESTVSKILQKEAMCMKRK